ncbi:family 16 glycosylhydrolase (plasmid) [Salipiger sp. H15]|uniref:Family 16 glycosylhydrolase n=1 Tax=Alloyangia sp. H15 TaxID=3029062 RepID=A0AAU8AP74_9RHOB
MTLIFEDNFEDGLNRYENGAGLWSTGSATGRLNTNSAFSVNLSGDEVTAEGGELGLDPFSTGDGTLRITSGTLTDAQKDQVAALLGQTGEASYLDTDLVDYYTGRMSTHETWSQTYGYFEITARIPQGKGHWPAFWLVSEKVNDWPPEITIMEAYGESTDGAQWWDDTFVGAVHFDSTDSSGNDAEIAIENPYDLDEDGNPSLPVDRSEIVGRESWSFGKEFDALEEFGADIYDQFWTWSVEWNAEDIIFYFGPDRDHLVEIFRSPTPDDITTPMSVIINDQIGSYTGWFAEEGASGFDLTDYFEVDSVSVWAQTPETAATVTAGEIYVDSAGDSVIQGSAGDDTIVTGDGFDILTLGGGADTVHVMVNEGHKIIEDFGPEDRLLLEGFRFADAADIAASLTQVGTDVWLSQGQFGDEGPQTIILRNTTVDAITEGQIVSLWPQTPDIWTYQVLMESGLIADDDLDGVVTAPEAGGRMTDAGSRGATFYGSEMGDTYTIYGALDVTIHESASGGVDTIYTQFSRTIAENVENMVSIATTDGQVLAGNAAANRITGSSWAETIDGAGGDDLIDLSAGGADTVLMRLGTGHDTVIDFGSDDTLLLYGYETMGWEALSQLFSSDGRDLTLTLDAHTQVTFRGIDALKKGQVVFADIPRVSGTAGDDEIELGSGDDEVLLGDGGADTLTIYGASGLKIVEDFSDDDRLVLEGWSAANVGQLLDHSAQVGDDLWVYDLGRAASGTPDLVLRGVSASDLTEAQLTLRWSITPEEIAAQDMLTDTDGDRRVVAPADGGHLGDAGSGSTTLVGGAGSDVFTVTRADTVIEDGSDTDVDTVRSTHGYTLGAHLENLTSIATADGETFIGNDSANRLTGSAYSETLDGGSGDDLIDLSAGGADTVRITAGAGHDTVVNFGADDTLEISGFDIADWAELVSRLQLVGDDLVLGLDAETSVTFRDLGSLRASQLKVDYSSEDAAHPTPGSSVSVLDKLYGSETGDAAQGNSADNTIYGNGGDDFIAGGLGDDKLYGNAGNDTLLGQGGDDLLTSGSGHNTLVGGAGADRFAITGESAADKVIYAGAAYDSISTIEDLSFGEGDVLVLRNAFGRVISEMGRGWFATFDTLKSLVDRYAIDGQPAVLLTADDGTRHVIDLSGYGDLDALFPELPPQDPYAIPEDALKVEDRAFGTSGDDVYLGSAAANVIFGGAGNDFIAGGDGADRLFGDAGDDTLRGGAGDDVLKGGDGRNVLIGDDGADRFWFEAATSETRTELAGQMFDSVTLLPDLDFGEGDNLYFASGFGQALAAAGLSGTKVSTAQQLDKLGTLGTVSEDGTTYVVLTGDDGSRHAVELALDTLL